MEAECLALKDLTSPRKSFTVELEGGDGGQSEQKENICTERRRTSPLKSAESAVPVLLMNRKGATPDLAHITPIKHTTLVEPWTPTANLKILISAASPDIREREMKKVLFRPIENEKPASPDAVVEDTEVEDSGQFEAAEEEDDVDKKPSRKQKSLGLLCQKFLALYPDYPSPHSPIWISLDEVATSLGVERRRIYDIINVLESLMIVGRLAKNCYNWFGRQRLEATLKELQQRGRQQGYHLQMEQDSEAREGGLGREDDGAEGEAGNAGGNRKDKSLRIMSEKFVMLFLVSKTQTVTLDAAAKILIEESQDSSSHSKYKTKVRRLYDIANVLTSLSLIKKVHVREERGRKPAFKWLGPVFNHSASAASGGDAVNFTLSEGSQPIGRQDLRNTKIARHASFNISTTSVGVQRQVSSAPSSPRQGPIALSKQSVDYSNRTSGADKGPTAALQTPTCSGRVPPPAAHAEHMVTPSSAPHCLAYLPSLSQPSVVMLYRAPDQKTEGHSSPGSEEGRKRRREESIEEGTVAKKKSGLEESDEMRADAQREAAGSSQTWNSQTSSSHPAGLFREQAFVETPGGSSEPGQPSHYLYVPNNAGLNSIKFLLSAGQSPAGVSIPPSGIPTLALPYVLLPPSALSHYPLVASALPQQGPDAHNQLSFSLPAVMSPGHFMVGAVPYGQAAAAAEVSQPPLQPPSTPEHSRQYASGTGTPHSPSGPRQTAGVITPEPLTPLTPKESTPSASRASFFQTPATQGQLVSAARKRGSAHRRLDVGHPPSGLVCEEMQ